MQVDRARGTLASGVFAERIAYEAQGTKLVIERFSARLRPGALLSARLEIEPLSVDRLSLVVAPGKGGAAQPPRLPPVGLRLAEARIGKVEIAAGDARLALRDVHIEHFELGSLRRVSARTRFTLADERFPAVARVELDGTLERLKATLAAELGEAHADVVARLAPFGAQPVESLELRARGVDIARFLAAAPHTRLEASASAQATAQGFAGSISATNAQAGTLDAARLPVASFAARFATQGTTSASFEQARIGLAGGAVLEGGGELAPQRASATVKVHRLDLRALQSTLRQTSLEGTLHVVATPQEQSVRAALSQQDISLAAEVVRHGERIEIGALHAAARGGELSGSGTVRLGEPLAFDARVRLARFDPSAFGDYPAGSLNGAATLSGRLGDAPQADVDWTVEDSTLYDLALKSHGRARLAPRRVSNAAAQAQLGEMQLDAHGSFGRTGDEMRFALRVPELSELASEISGRVSAQGALRGDWQAPQGELSAQGEELQAPGGVLIERATLRFAGTAARHGLSLTAHAYDSDAVAELRGGLEGKTWRGEVVSLASSGKVEFQTEGSVPLAISRERIALGRLEARLARGRFLVRELVRTPQGLRSSGEFSGLRAASLLAATGMGERVHSTLLLNGEWAVSAAPALEGTLRVRRTQGDITVLAERTVDLGLQALSLDARLTSAGVAAKMELSSRFVNAALGGQIGRAPGAGGVGLGPASAIVLQGNVELASLGVLAGPYVTQGRVDGKLSADVDIAGTLGKPALAATLRGEGLSLDVPPYGLYLRDGTLRARLENDALQVEKLSVRGGRGTLTAQGRLPLRLAEGNASLAWQAEHFTVLDRQEMRLVASGKGEVAFDGQKLRLSGALVVDRGSFEYTADRLPELADDIVVEGAPRRRARAAETTLPIALDVDVDLGSDLVLRMRGFDGKLAGTVNIKTSPEGHLLVYGEVRAVNATFLAYGKRLRVDPGIVTFDGPIDNPGLQITAWRRNQAVEAGIQISGTVRAPRVQLVSQPPVPENERLTWLVLGRAPEDTTKADLGLLQAAAGALLARGDVTSTPIDQRLAKSFGLDEISLRYAADVESRAVAFGKRLSDKVYISYEQGLGTVASNLVKLDYSLSRRWSARVETGTSSGGGLFYRFSWD